jgi:hypothetical protein
MACAAPAAAQARCPPKTHKYSEFLRSVVPQQEWWAMFFFPQQKVTTCAKVR